jgi:hypothetical protein
MKMGNLLLQKTNNGLRSIAIKHCGGSEIISSNIGSDNYARFLSPRLTGRNKRGSLKGSLREREIVEELYSCPDLYKKT